MGPDTPGTSKPPPEPGARVLQSSELLQGGKEVLIRHGEEIYRLRLTRSGKLMLQK